MVYTVGEMAKLLGVAASTLRYYDKEGLLPFVERIARRSALRRSHVTAHDLSVQSAHHVAENIRPVHVRFPSL